MAAYSVVLDEKTRIDRLVNETGTSSVTINRYGGEVIGYRISRDGDEIPLLYRDGEADKPESGWKNHATVLFPVVGGLKNDRSMLGDVAISSRGNHGYARHSMFSPVESGTDGGASLHYRLSSDEETKKYYPFDCDVDITYRLEGDDLTAAFSIKNTEPEQDIYYCFGWHPGFRTPVVDGNGAKADCQLLFKKGTYRKYHNNEFCRLTGETSDLALDGPLARTEEELEATIMLEIDDPALRTCTLFDPASKLNIQVDFPQFPHLGFWSEPGYNFICIEPWQGMDDHEEQEPFDRKVGVVKLAPGAADRRSITVKPFFT